MVRAFLSHSSANKGLVAEVFSALGPGLAEYDSQTFISGRFNTDTIRIAMSRCQMCVVFATTEALTSGFVQYEIAVASEFLAAKTIRRILTFCISPVTPADLPAELRLISAVRRTASPGTCARLIRSELIALDVDMNPTSRPYLGRERITAKITDRLARPDEPIPVAIALSGMDGIGRRTLATKILADVYPRSGTVFPSITINQNYDLRDLFRALLDLSGGLTKAEIFDRVSSFDASEQSAQNEQVAAHVKSFTKDGETIILIDNGGLLDDSGALSPYFMAVVQLLTKYNTLQPHFVLILFRTPPAQSRLDSSIIYFRVEPLEGKDIRKLVSLHIKAKGQLASPADVDRLVDLIDGHPYNLQFLLRLLDTQSIQSIVQDPSDLIAFKQRQGDSFVSRIQLTDNHRQILAALRVLGQSPIELVSASVSLQPDELSRTLKELEELHCIERTGNVCAVNRPLRSAFDRSQSVRLAPEQVALLQSKVLELFRSYFSDDEISIELISAAARAAVYLNKNDDALRAFVLPSSSIFVGKQLYDLRKYQDCARVCQQALVDQRFISEAAWVEAIRLRCLSLARLGEDDAFNTTIARLDTSKNNQRAEKLYLEGFLLRLSGEPAAAVAKYKASYKLKEDTFAVLRELSHTLAVVGELAEAKVYAEKALKVAPTNPYLIDQMLSIKIAQMGKVTRDMVYEPEVAELLDQLEKFGDEDGKSFYAIRMADILMRSGELSEALDYADRACRLTSYLASAHFMRAQILLRMRLFPKVEAELQQIQSIIDDTNSGERRSRLAEFLLLKTEYLLEISKVGDAINLARRNERRIAGRVTELKRRIALQIEDEQIQHEIDKRDRDWLKAG